MLKMGGKNTFSSLCVCVCMFQKLIGLAEKNGLLIARVGTHITLSPSYTLNVSVLIGTENDSNFYVGFAYL